MEGNEIDDFFKDFEALPSVNPPENDPFAVDIEHAFEPSEIITTKHDPFFKNHNINPNEILAKTDFTMSNNEEIFVGLFKSSKRNEDLHLYATKADTWCFIVFKGISNYRKRFFFECALKI